jgi:hypothetical protein
MAFLRLAAVVDRYWLGCICAVWLAVTMWMVDLMVGALFGGWYTVVRTVTSASAP